jgi:hypothetical protein
VSKRHEENLDLDGILNEDHIPDLVFIDGLIQTDYRIFRHLGKIVFDEDLVQGNKVKLIWEDLISNRRESIVVCIQSTTRQISYLRPQVQASPD